jgi:hypothetical protein
MPTQEERVTTLEFDLKQFKTEAVKVYTDMAFEMTMVKGLTEDAIKRLASLRTQMDERFDLVDVRLNQMYDEINSHTLLLHQILDRLPTKE